MVETPALYPNLTARDNLKARAILMNYQGDLDSFCDEQLHFVGLDEVAHSSRQAKDFSLGMRQRLGIAIALTGDPELLILDEPTNGLDPQGILEVRNLLLRLNREKGITILVSSHILGELSKLATRYVIIDNAKIVAEASAEEVENGSGKSLHLITSDNAKAKEVVEALKFAVSEKGEELIVRNYTESGFVVTKVVQSGVLIHRMREEMGSLESYFLSHIEGEEVAKAEGERK
jgi:ABC-2 type transport system ATP-binding protein